MAERKLLKERLLSFLKGDAKPTKQPEYVGKGAMYGFDSRGSTYYTYVNQQFTLEQKRMRLDEYKELEWFPETAEAIDLIVDSCVQKTLDDDVIKLEVVSDDLKKAKNGKVTDMLYEEFENFIEHVYGGEAALTNNFRRWYVDGELWLETVKGNEGYALIKPLPAETMMMELDEKGAVLSYIQNVGEWDQIISYGLAGNPKFTENSRDVIRFNAEEITYLDSAMYGPGGLIDPRSRLEIALRPYRQLRLLEDALVIYRLVRAPEKRVFNVDVGTLPKGQAEEYLENLMKTYQQKQLYDPRKGDVIKQYNPIAMTEDFWIPTRGGTGGTKIETLMGAQNLGVITDVEYFLKKIYSSLKVPTYLTDSKEGLNDKTQQVREQDVRFARHCERLQDQWLKHLHAVFVHHLRLKSKKLDAAVEDLAYRDIKLIMAPPSYYKEFKDIEVESARVQLFTSMMGTGAFPKKWLMKNVLKMGDDIIEEVIKDIPADEVFEPLDKNVDRGGSLFGTSDVEEAEKVASGDEGKAKITKKDKTKTTKDEDK